MKNTQQNVNLEALRLQMEENLLTVEAADSIKGGLSGLRSRYKPRQTSSTTGLSSSLGSIGVNRNGYAVEGLL